MRSLSRLLAPDRIIRLSGRTRDQILSELADAHSRHDETIPKEEVLKALVEREELGSTAIGTGLALPHARIQKLRDFSMVLGIHPKGVDFGAFDNNPVRSFVLIVGPASENDLFVQILARTSRFLRDKRKDLLSASTPEDIYGMTLEY